MTNKPIPKEPKNVSCDVCLTEIPESVAMSSEGDEYAQHFCGIECYDKWRDSDGSSPAVKNDEAINDEK